MVACESVERVSLKRSNHAETKSREGFRSLKMPSFAEKDQNSGVEKYQEDDDKIN